jgi:hypothetical protein
MRCFTEACVENRINAFFELIPFILWAIWAYVSFDYIRNRFLRALVNLASLMIIVLLLDLTDVWPFAVWGHWVWLMSPYVRRMVVRWSINIVVLWVLMQISGHVR